MTGINTNTAALMARAYGQKANQKLLEPMKRLSSGLRINSAADDAAGLAVSNKMQAAIKSYSMGVKNSVDMISLLTTAESSLSEITNIQMRVRELAVQSANGVYTNDDRDKMELELISLVQEIDRIAANTKFNDVNLLDGTFTGKTVQTGKDYGDLVDVNIGQFASCEIGRFWETDTFANGDFSSSGAPVALGNDVYSISGWEIHNKRVELGEEAQGNQPAANSPATVVNRDGDTVENKIGGWAIPKDPTPRPYKNAIDVLVNPSNSNTTSDTALTYGTTYTNIVDPLPPNQNDPGTFNVVVGAMTSVTPTIPATTNNGTIMGATYQNVTGDAPAAGGTQATFNVSIGAMTVTPTANTTTSNVGLMGQSYTNVSGTNVSGSGSGAKFSVNVGQMTFTPASTSTSNTDIMGQTLTNISSVSSPDHGGTHAKFNVTIGEMTVTQTTGTTTDTTSMLGRSFTNVAGTGGSGANAKFSVNIGQMTFNLNTSTTADGERFGRTYRNVTASGPSAGGQAAVFDVTIDSYGNISTTVVNAGSGYTANEAVTIQGSLIGGDANDNLSLNARAATVTATLTSKGSGYQAGDTITIQGGLIGGVNGTDDVQVRVNQANINVSLTDAGSGYVGYVGAIKIPGTSLGGGAGDDITLNAGNAPITVSVTNKGTGYQAGDVVRVPVGAGGDTVDVTVNAASVSVSLVNPGSGYKVGEQIRISGTQFGGHDTNDQVTVVGNNPTITVDATSGSGYTVGGTVTLGAGTITAGAQELPTTVVKVPPGTDDSSRPADFGNIENDSQTGFTVEDGIMKLDTGSMTSVYGWDIVHGPYIISDRAKAIKAGEKVFFDWKASGTNDAFDVFAYLLNVDTGATQILLDSTQQNAGSTNWATVETTVQADGNYKYVFINGTYDATGGKLLGAEMYIDNIYIERQRLPADEQHTVCKISLQTVAEANNAISVLDLAISQTSSVRSQMGALINRLGHSLEAASQKTMKLKQASSRVMDAEYTIETSKLAKYQILSNASAAMLAQANSSKNSVLELLR